MRPVGCESSVSEIDERYRERKEVIGDGGRRRVATVVRDRTIFSCPIAMMPPVQGLNASTQLIVSMHPKWCSVVRMQK